MTTQQMLDERYGRTRSPHARVWTWVVGVVVALLVGALLDRFPGLRLAVPAEEVPFRKGALIRGPEAMPVTWSESG